MTFRVRDKRIKERGIASFDLYRLMGNGFDEDWQANARLIAAAPDLLAALQLATDHIEATAHLLTEEAADEEATFVVREARAAIAKATGGK